MADASQNFVPGALSPDGMYVWGGRQWVLLIAHDDQRAAVAGSLSPDGGYVWTGDTWLPLLRQQPQRQSANPESVDAMDVDDAMEVDQRDPVNTYDLTDNCYYVTAAALLGVTVGRLIERTEMMQVRDGAGVDEVTRLFAECGLSGLAATCNDLVDLATYVRDNAGGQDRRFGLGFRRSDGSDHMVVAQWDANQQALSYHDYQRDPSGADATGDVQNGVVFLVFAWS